MKSKRCPAWILIILILIAIGIGVYFWLTSPTSYDKGKEMICGDNICYGKYVELRVNESITFLDKKITFLGPYREEISPYYIKMGLRLKVGETEKMMEYDKRRYIEGVPIQVLGGGPEKYSLNLGESAWSCFEDCKSFPGQTGEIIECEKYTGKNSTCVDFPSACEYYFKDYNYTVEVMTEGRLCISKGPELNMFGTTCCIITD